ncbi:extracellular calcium-sensing receptor-like [Leptodactylus fuscus]
MRGPDAWQRLQRCKAAVLTTEPPCGPLLTMFLLLFVLCANFHVSETQDPAAQCDLVMKNYTFEYKYSQEGDIILGGIFTVHSWVSQWAKRDNLFFNQMCSAPHPREYLHLAAFRFAIEEINNRSDLLPNITLGYHIYDSCGDVNKVIKDVLQILSGHTVTAPNYSCMENDAVVGFIGDFRSVTTLPMAQLLSLYGYTQISYGASDPLLRDRKLYPNFLRTVPDDTIQSTKKYEALMVLLEEFRWNWVGIITSDDEGVEREQQQLSKLFTFHHICVEFRILVPDQLDLIPLELQNCSTDVIIICGSYSLRYVKFLYNVAHVLANKTLILPRSWSFAQELLYTYKNGVSANCSLIFSLPRYDIPGMREHFCNIYYSNQSSEPVLEDIWMITFNCFSKNELKNLLIPKVHRHPFRYCSGEPQFTIQFNFLEHSAPYHVYIAVLLMAQALHNMNTILNDGKHNVKLYDYKHKVSMK